MTVSRLSENTHAPLRQKPGYIHKLTHLHNGELLEFYLKDGLHIWPYEAGGIGDQVTKHTGTLLFVPANTTVLQLC